MKPLSFAHAAECSALVGALTATTPRTGLAQPGGNAVGESFAVASVRPVEKPQFRRPVLSQLPGGRFEATNAGVPDLIRYAYGLQDFDLVAGAPGWAGNQLDSARFDIVATAEYDPDPR